MKLVFLFHSSYLGGGAPRSGINTLSGLRDAGIGVLAICPKEGELSELLRSMEIPVSIVEYTTEFPQRPRTLKRLLSFLPILLKSRVLNRNAIKKLDKIVKSFKPDIIHSNSSVIKVGFDVAKINQIPHILHCREFGLKDTSYFTGYVKSMQKYQKAYFVSITKAIAEHYKLSENKHNRVIYNGIYPSNDALEITNNSGNYYLYVGGIYKPKGIEDILNAFFKLPEDIRSRYPLYIAGAFNSREYQNYLFKLCQDTGNNGYVKWLGLRSDIKPLMNGAKALIVASPNEAFGRVMAEAMFCSCLVIARNAAGLKEQFDNGLNLYHGEIGIRFNSVDDLQKILLEVSSHDNSKYETMIRNGQNTVISLYSNEANVSKTIEFYREIIESERNG